jgi:hypothetical protein
MIETIVVYALLIAAFGVFAVYAAARAVSEGWHSGRIAVEVRAKKRGLI